MNALDRRRVLTLSTLALAGTALAGCVAPASSSLPGAPRKRRLRKALGIGMIGAGETLAEKFALARDCGFEGVEMDGPSGHALEDVLAARDRSGLAIPSVVDSVHWQYSLGDADPEVRAKGRAGLEAALRDAHAYGARSVLLVPAVVDKKRAYDVAWEHAAAEIRAVVPLAHELGVRIAIENVWNNFIMSPMEAARYVDDFNDPMVAWHFDIGNVINYGWPDQWVKVLGKRIAKLHIKDFSRKKRNDEGLWKGFDVELGDGDAGWAAVMKALDEVGYSTAPGGNWATAEVGGGDEKRLKTVSEQMDKLFAM